MYWLYDRPFEATLRGLEEKLPKRPELAETNKLAMQAGYNAGDIHGFF